MSDIEKVDKFLTDAEVFYLASVTEENKPKCRPLGFHMLEGDKIYFGVGTFKEVYAQITANPYVEIVATTFKEVYAQITANPYVEIVATQSPKFIRYYGKVVIDEDESLADKAFEKMPDLKKIYDENGWKMGIFHLEEATAEFRNMMAIEETYTF